MACELGASLAGLAACAANDNNQVQSQHKISLDDFEVVIADMGEISEGWSAIPARVSVKVLDGPDTREMYFDSLLAAVFMLREIFGTPRILQLDVAEYSRAQQQDGQCGMAMGPCMLSRLL